MIVIFFPVTQLVLSNLAFFNCDKELEENANEIFKNIIYDASEFKEFLNIAIDDLLTISAHTKALIGRNSAQKNLLFSFPNINELRCRFLSFVALFAENIVSNRLTSETDDTLFKLIEKYFNIIVSGIYYSNNPADIGFIKHEGFALAMVKLRLFLIKHKYGRKRLSAIKPSSADANSLKTPEDNSYSYREALAQQRDSNSNVINKNKIVKGEFDNILNINDKILRVGLSFIDPKTKFVNIFLKDFDEIYENLNIKYNPEMKSFIMDSTKYLEEDQMKEFLSDFYSYKNTIYLQSFFFYDQLIYYLDNFEKVPSEFIDTLNLIVNHVISCCDLKTEKNYLGSSVKKNSNYLMRFIMDEQLNKQKNHNKNIKQLLEAFWKMLYYVIKNDEENIICQK